MFNLKSKFEKLRKIPIQLKEINNKTGMLLKKIDDMEKTIEELKKEITPAIVPGNYIISIAENYWKVLDICGCSKENFAKLELWERNDGVAQIFNIKYVGSGLYIIIPACSDKVLDVNVKEAVVQQYEWINMPTQRWYIEDVGDGEYNIISEFNHQYMSIQDEAANSGSFINLVDDSENGNIRFRFYPVKEYSVLKSVITKNLEYEKEMLNKINVYNFHEEIRFWLLYKNDDESIDMAKKRFFMNLPKARGNLRILQEAENELLCGFDKLCREYDLKYWLWGGTLLGAIRHKGFIPWDDDLDIGMMRDELQKLRKIIIDNSNYKITEVFDPIAQSLQIRFKYKDVKNPLFIDIFSFDYCCNGDNKTWIELSSVKEKLSSEININLLDNKHNYKHYILDTDLEFYKFKEIFERYQKDVLMQKCDGMGIFYGIDNATGKTKLNYNIDDIFPLTELEFEGKSYYVVNSYKEMVESIYGDIYKLPEDLFTHFEHISTEEIEEYIKKLGNNI